MCVQIFIHRNSRLLQFLFLVALLGLLFASCRSSQKIISTKKDNSTNAELTEKYATLLGVPKKKLNNVVLLKFLDEWYGVPYKYGGKDKLGVDCSAFSCRLENDVYKRKILGSAQGLYEQCISAKISSLNQGDLVFFKIDTKKVSHVGVYLMNNKFVHATSKKGVMINDLDENYYKKYFFAAGQLK